MRKLFLVLLLAVFVFPMIVRASDEATDRGSLRTPNAGMRSAKLRIAVERINLKMTEMNKRRTGIMREMLKKMKTLLEKVATARDRAKTAGKNTTEVDTAITGAQTAIDQATVAVEAQMNKSYAAVNSTDITAKQELRSVISQLRLDLKATHDRVVAARQAVARALAALAKVRGGK